MKKQKNQKRHHTQQNIDKDLDKMLFLAAEQKLLPKIIYEYSFQHNSPKFMNRYRESVKQIYTKQTAHPLKYNEQDAKTHRQKFREKILKLINNQLPIDYLNPIKINNQYVMGYKGQPLQKIQYPTKPQFKIFSDFNENKFKKGYQNIFDDKLQYKQTQLTKSIQKQRNIRIKTKPSQHITQQYSNKILYKPSQQHKNQSNNKQKIIQGSLPKLIARTQFDRAKLLSPKPNTKKKIKLPKNLNYDALILDVMTKIGKYTNITQNNISITKQSILKYFRQCYQRPHRIVDFLEFSDVQNFNSFSKIPQKLKLMNNQHIYFMTFLFYDSNNDGYICSNDLLRIEELSKKCPLVMQDVQIIRNGSYKIKFQTTVPYLDLYRYSQVSETTYFNWLKKQKDKDIQQNPQTDSYKQQLKDYFQQLNKKKIFVHYEGFKKLYQNQKPYLWYDLIYRLSGVKYEGLKYQ